MTARKVHFDAHGEFTALCGATPREGAKALLTTGNRDQVSCGHCLKVMADIEQAKTNDILARANELAEETEAFLKTQAISKETLYTSDAYLTPTGPLVERHEYVIPNTFDDRAIAQRHGLERFEVENAINDGWLKR